MSFVSAKWQKRVCETVDTNFVEIVEDKSMSGWGAIIDVYEKRNLNVAGNLAKAIWWFCSDDYLNLGIKQLLEAQIEHCKTEPRFAKYEQDVQKYLILL